MSRAWLQPLIQMPWYFNNLTQNVPFHYIPFEAHTFMGKKIYYAGARETFNEMYILGDVDTWDFVAFYGL